MNTKIGIKWENLAKKWSLPMTGTNKPKYHTETYTHRGLSQPEENICV